MFHILCGGLAQVAEKRQAMPRMLSRTERYTIAGIQHSVMTNMDVPPEQTRRIESVNATLSRALRSGRR